MHLQRLRRSGFGCDGLETLCIKDLTIDTDGMCFFMMMTMIEIVNFSKKNVHDFCGDDHDDDHDLEFIRAHFVLECACIHVHDFCGVVE